MRHLKNLLLSLALLGLVSRASADDFSDDFESYGATSASEIALTGQGGWLTADGVDQSPPDSSGAYVHEDYGVGDSDGLYFKPGAPYQHLAHSVGSLAAGDQVSLSFQISHAAGFTELWIGDNRHVTGDSAGDEVAMHVEMGVSGANMYYYNLIQDSPNKSQTGNIELAEGAAGQRGQWAEVRMTLDKVGGETTWGLDTATVEARNITLDTPFQTLGSFPMNTQGIGWDDLYLVLGGQSGSEESHITLFDNLSLEASAGVLNRHTWQANGVGDWSSPLSWLPSRVPTESSQTVLFGAPASITDPTVAVVTSPVAVNRIEFNSAVQPYVVAGYESVTLATDPDDAEDPEDAFGPPSLGVYGGLGHQFQAVVNLADDTTADVGAGTTLSFNNALNLAGNTLLKTGEGTVLINNVLNSGGGNVDVQSGTVSGAGTIGGNLTNASGSIAPGMSPGKLTVGGDFQQQAAGTLQIEIGGMTQGEQYDVLAVNGSATVNGTLEVSLIEGFSPPGGQEFTVLTSAVLTDEGLTLAGPSAEFFSLVVNGSDLVLRSAGSAIPGDYNGNGQVDAADYTVWRDTFGQSVTPGTGADGVINEHDYTMWFARFGNSGTGAGQAVPEPAGPDFLWWHQQRVLWLRTLPTGGEFYDGPDKPVCPGSRVGKQPLDAMENDFEPGRPDRFSPPGLRTSICRVTPNLFSEKGLRVL